MEQPVLLRTVTVLLGALLSGYLVYLFLRKNFMPLLALLGISMSVWFSGQFLVIAIRSVGWTADASFLRTLRLIAYAGLALESPLLLHALVRYAWTESGRKGAAWVLAAIYLPLLLLVPAAVTFEFPSLGVRPFPARALPTFLFVKTGYVLAATGLCVWLRTRTERQDVRYFSTWFPVFLLASLVFTWSVYLTTGLERTGYLSALTYGAPLLPLLFLFWTIHRYHLLAVDITDHSILAFSFIVTVSLYFITVRHAGNWLKQKHGINPEAFELLLFLVLMVLFTVIGRWVFKLTDTRIRRNSFDVLDELADELEFREIGREGGIQLIESGLEQAFQAPVTTVRGEDARAFCRLFDERPGRPVTVLDPSPEEAIRELRNRNALVAVPLSDTDTCLAVFFLGPRRQYLNYNSEELDAIAMIMRHFREAVKNHDLLQNHLALERKHQQNEKLEALGNVAAACAHEVKNPLSSIHGIISSMDEEITDEDPHRKDVEVIQNELDRLRDVVGQILNFARRGRASQERIDVNEVVQSVVYVLARAPEGIQVDLSLPDRPLHAYTVESDLKGILFNLLRNAIEASPRGETIDVQLEEEGNHSVSISITNRGAPPDEDVLKEIQSETPGSMSTRQGLGLTIVLDQIKQMNGTLEVNVDENVPETTFTVLLPKNKGESS